jgi:uracil-DNA glycosylase
MQGITKEAVKRVRTEFLCGMDAMLMDLIGSSSLGGDARAAEFERIEAATNACRLCPDAGFPTEPGAIYRGSVDAPIVVIGQAPGKLERLQGLPFVGPAGKRLMTWMAQAGFAEEEFRALTYFSAMTKCFPGAAPKGDRRPTRREVALCRPFLLEPLRLLRPRIVLLIGGMAIEEFLGKQPLERVVGQVFRRGDVHWIPLPHPSGASLWLNDPAHRALVDQALEHLRVLRPMLGLAGQES